ncbi:uncharacterized protein LOC107855604 isoform X1 [Capsicum annuum]|uniref:uncharacterized protein LOC107855604 isoform X1 n=2 Tax=Capsicum annuum TaxID=4072 RepID=UPI0007BEAA62|nr:uncharacterized protein LOC107855604 isoform X1 [Capsicum annuum]
MFWCCFIISVVGCLQGIKLDNCITLDGLASISKKPFYMCLHCIAIPEAFDLGIFTGSNLLCPITTPGKVWVAYKESSWLTATILIILLNLCGSTITCAYIALQLFRLSSQDSIYLVLFSNSNREENEGMKEPLTHRTWEGLN